MTDQDRIRAIFLRTRETIYRMVMEYGASKEEHLEIRHLEKMDAINDARTPMEALQLAERATTSVHTTLLALLGRGKILGRNPAASFEKKARKAESRIRMFEKMSTSKFSSAKEVASSKKKAERERIKADELWKKAGKERPVEIILSDDEMEEAEAEITKKASRVRTL